MSTTSTEPAETGLRDPGAVAVRAEFITVLLAGSLAVAKFIVYFLTGSISILASAADSSLDVAASSINWFAVRTANEPPDEEHSYGHGKYEAAAGIFQAGVVATAACYLLYAAIVRILAPQPVEQIPLGLAMMAVSTVVSILITIILKSAGRASGSLAIEGDALHYTTDVLANIATIAALLLERFTSYHFWDPAISLLLTLYLLRAAWGVGSPAWNILVDRQLSDEDVQLIEDTLQKSSPPEVIGYYGLRTRTSGRMHFADVCVVFASGVGFERVHDITETIEDRITACFDRAEVVIHPEPEGAHGLETHELTWTRR